MAVPLHLFLRIRLKQKEILLRLFLRADVASIVETMCRQRPF